MTLNEPEAPKKGATESDRRQKARIRRNNVELRAAARYEGRAASIFLLDKPVVIGPHDSKVVAPLLVPDRERKNFEGRYASRKVLQQLRNALAVHALATYYSLIAIYDNRIDSPERRAQDLIEDASGKKWRQLRKYAVEHLDELTPFHDIADVKRWASHKIKGMQASRRMTRHRTDHAAIEAELAAVKLLSLAWQRAKVIVAEFEKVEKLAIKAKTLQMKAERQGCDETAAAARERIWAAFQAKAHERIEAALNSPGWDCAVSDLIQIAIFADINPAVLWPQKINLFASFFEAARFVGRVNAGRAAALHPDLHGLVGDILRSKPVYDFKVGQVAASDLRHHLTQHFDADTFLALIAQVDSSKQWIGVTAIDRQLVLFDCLGPPTKLGKRVRAFFDLLARTFRRFSRRNPAYKASPGDQSGP